MHFCCIRYTKNGKPDDGTSAADLRLILRPAQPLNLEMAPVTGNLSRHLWRDALKYRAMRALAHSRNVVWSWLCVNSGGSEGSRLTNLDGCINRLLQTHLALEALARQEVQKITDRSNCRFWSSSGTLETEIWIKSPQMMARPTSSVKTWRQGPLKTYYVLSRSSSFTRTCALGDDDPSTSRSSVKLRILAQVLDGVRPRERERLLSG